MVNTLNFFDPSQWQRIKYSVSLGDGSFDIRGVCFDGSFFWTAHSGGQIRQWSLDSGSFFNQGEIDVSSQLPDFFSLRAICTDGDGFYVVMQDNVGDGEIPPTFIQNSYIVKVNKEGKTVGSFFGGFNSTSNVGYFDITYDGRNVIASRQDDKIVFFDASNGKLLTVSDTMIRTFPAIAWNGNSLYGVRNTGHGHQITFDGTIITNQVANPLGVTSRGMDHGTNKIELPGQFGWLDGEWVVVATNGV